MAYQDEDALLELSVLKFAPVGPSLTRSSRSTSSPIVQGQRALMQSADQAALNALAQEIKTLQQSLQVAVSDHEEVLLAGTGNVAASRLSLAHTIQHYQEALAERAALRQFHVTRLLGAREDAQRRLERIEQLSQGSRAQQELAEAHEEDEAELRALQDAMDDLQRQIKQLGSQKSEVKQRMRARQQDRLEQNKRVEAERKSLQAGPSIDDINRAITESRQAISQDEDEIQALEDGQKLFDEVMERVRRVEQDLSAMLPASPPSDALHILDEAIKQLQTWHMEVEAKGWRLIAVIITCELEVLVVARDMLREQLAAAASDHEKDAEAQFIAEAQPDDTDKDPLQTRGASPTTHL